jgi:hypothetical protein
MLFVMTGNDWRSSFKSIKSSTEWTLTVSTGFIVDFFDVVCSKSNWEVSMLNGSICFRLDLRNLPLDENGLGLRLKEESFSFVFKVDNFSFT